MRIVFMGTPEVAVPTLRRCLEDGYEVTAVWTQPDKPAGRGNRVAESPIKTFALAHGLTVYQPAKIKTDEAKQLFASHSADIAVVVAYGRILPAAYLRATRRGCVNVHFSLLPLYRGAAPVNWAIINGEWKTGVTTMFIREELDAGPILLQAEIPIGKKDTAPELAGRLSILGAEVLSQTLGSLDVISPRPQRDRDATYAPMLVRGDGLISWSDSAFIIERCIRGLQPWPNAFTQYRSRRLIIWKGEPVEMNVQEAVTAEVVVAQGDNLIIKCGEQTALRVLELQTESGRRMSARDFLNGTHIHAGDKLGVGQ